MEGLGQEQNLILPIIIFHTIKFRYSRTNIQIFILIVIQVNALQRITTEANKSGNHLIAFFFLTRIALSY